MEFELYLNFSSERRRIFLRIVKIASSSHKKAFRSEKKIASSRFDLKLKEKPSGEVIFLSKKRMDVEKLIVKHWIISCTARYMLERIQGPGNHRKSMEGGGKNT